MRANMPIRHLLCFRGRLEKNVLTIRKRSQMSKDVHIISLNGQLSVRGCWFRRSTSSSDRFISGVPPGRVSYVISWRELQRPNELSGVARPRIDTFPLGVTTDHIRSSLPSHPLTTQSMTRMSLWEQRCCHNKLRSSENIQTAALIYSVALSDLSLEEELSSRKKKSF